jgi:hypothetical protein
MSETTMTGEEMFESLTGFEEVAVSQHFNAEVGNLAESKPTMFLRAMVFTHLVREGRTPKEAKAEVMGMTLKACNGYFAEDDEITPDEPVTLAGEGDSPPD